MAAQPQRKPSNEDSASTPLNARGRANDAWGMSPNSQQGEESSNDEGYNNPLTPTENTAETPKESARDRANTAWGMGGNNIAKEEANPNIMGGNGLAGAMNGGEKNLSTAPNPIKTSFTPDKGGFFNQGVKLFGRNIGSRKKVGGAVGGVAGLGLLVAVYMAGASLYLINIKNFINGPSNQYSTVMSNQIQNRRVNSSMKILKKTAQKIEVDKFAQKLGAEGYEAVIEKGAVTVIKNAEGEVVLDLTKSTKNITKQVRALSKNEAGRTFLSSYNKLTSEFGARVRGPVTRKKVYQRLLGATIFVDWIKNVKLTGEIKNIDEFSPKAGFSTALYNSSKTEKQILRSLSVEDAARVLNLQPGELPVDITVDDIFKKYGDEAAEFAKKVAGSNGERVLIEGFDEISKEGIGRINDVLRTAGDTSGTLIKNLASNLGLKKISTKIGEVVVKSGDLTTPVRVGCRAKGTLAFVKNVKNVMIAIELMKFTLKFYTIADHQQAGLASGTSIKLMSTYMSGAMGSSGFSSLSTGKAALEESVRDYGVGYGLIGVLATIEQYLKRVPFLEPDNCKLVNNPLVQVGGTLAGGALAVLTGATSFGVSLGWSIGLTLANEVAFGIATPLMLATLSGALISGYETPEQAGSALIAGKGALDASTFTANGALPSKAEDLALPLENAKIMHREELNSRSFADRYLNINSSDSLMARASMQMPYSLSNIASIFQNRISIGNIVSPFSSTLSLVNEPAYALAPCALDETAQKYGIACDAFGNIITAYVPILDLDNTEAILREKSEINIAGEPVPGSDFQKFIDNCFSGRPGVLHPIEVTTEGSTDPNDPTCVVGASEGPYTGSFEGDVAEEIESGESERIPLIKERFAAWYGFLVDEENLSADINDQLSGTNSAPGEANNNNIFFLGDSLTVGMQSLGGSDTNKDYLQRTFNAEGWSASVDAKGCRAVYQTQGAFEGGGNGCPAGTINDGISAVNDPANAQYLNSDQAGTVVIGLGTNQYETDSNGRVSQQLFEEKVRLLISDIRKKSPNAEIYWVNLVDEPETNSRQERNTILNKVAVADNFTVLDWNDYVGTAKSTPTTEDDVGFADDVHHTVDGYSKKVQYLLDNVIQPAGNTKAGTKNLNCTGYKEITAPSTVLDRSYSANIQTKCQELKAKCTNGIADTERILCSAFEFDGAYYGNSYGAYSGSNGNKLYGFNVSGNFGIQAESWLEKRSEGLSQNNLLECSGLTSVSLFRAYGVGGVGCSGNWTERVNPQLFRELSDVEIKPGDFLTKSFGCNSDASNASGGHVAIAASTPDANGNLIVYETDSWGKPVRFTEKNLSAFPGGHSRYIGAGAQ